MIPIQDLFDMDNHLTVSELIQQIDAYDRLKSFNEKLHNEFNYIEFIHQPVEYVGQYEFSLDFVNGYLESNQRVDLSNQNVIINDETAYITPLNAIQSDYNGYHHYALQVEIGRNFIEDDFYFSPITPIILGNHYKEYYKINDIMEFYHLGRKTTAEVIGFLPEDTFINDSSGVTFLDNYILMPFYFEINPDDLNDFEYLYSSEDQFINENVSVGDFFSKLYYMQKNNGYLLLDYLSEIETVRERIEAIAEEFNLNYTVLVIN